MASDGRVEIAELPFCDPNSGKDRLEPGQAAADGRGYGGGDAEIVRSWLSSFDPTASARTLLLYGRVTNGFLHWLKQSSLTLATLTAADLARYRDELRGADSTRANRLAVAKSLLTYAHAVGHTASNVGRSVRGPRVTTDCDARALSEADVRSLIDAAAALLRAEQQRTLPRARFLKAARMKLYLVRFLYLSGCRVSEAVSVRWCDLRPRVDGDAQLTVVGKGTKRRTLPMPGEFVSQLRLECDSVAGGALSRLFPFGVRRAQTILAELGELAGLQPGVSAHWLRHACATHALARGAPPHVVQRSLGHASLATTGRYAHALADGSSKYLPSV